jgi:hypothetical protein
MIRTNPVIPRPVEYSSYQCKVINAINNNFSITFHAYLPSIPKNSSFALKMFYLYLKGKKATSLITLLHDFLNQNHCLFQDFNSLQHKKKIRQECVTRDR